MDEKKKTAKNKNTKVEASKEVKEVKENKISEPEEKKKEKKPVEKVFVVNAGLLALRSEPNGQIIHTLQNGTRVTATEKDIDGWIKVSVSDSMSGYVNASYLKEE